MNTENFILSLLITNYCSKWHVFEHIIDLLENTVWVVDILSKSFSTFCSKTKISIDVTVFVVSSHHEDLLWIFQLQCH